MTSTSSLGLERQSADLVVAEGVHEEPAPQQHGELAQVHLRDHHLVVSLEHLTGVGRERVEVAQVRLGDLMPERRAIWHAAPMGP